MLYNPKGYLVGALLGYSRQQLQQQELTGAIQLLFASPLHLKWHILTTVRRALANYVLLPSKDAFYINNVAVFSNARGQDLGTSLLDDLCHQLKQQGYRCVELDVTFCNKGAIRFYQRYGFYRVSQSGSETLSQQYGLPLLLRLRYVLPKQSKKRNNRANPNHSANRQAS